MPRCSKRRNLMVSVLACLLAIPQMASAGQVRQDVGSFFRQENLLVLAAGLGLSGAVSGWDDQANSRLEDNAFLNAADVTNLYGGSKYNLPAAGLLWVYGRASGYKEVCYIASTSLRTLVYVQAVVGPTKLVVGRERPDGTNRLSFPSGHTANSFALAELFRQRYGWKAGGPMYSLAVLTGMGRMEENVHHLSDVVAGAAIGFAIGRSVNHVSGPIQVVPTARGLGLSMKF